MACTIKFNKNGGIANVFTPEGKESKLFKQIAKFPHTGSLEEALEVLKNVYSDKAGIYKQTTPKTETVKIEVDQENLTRMKELSGKIDIAATPKIKEKLQNQLDSLMESTVIKNLQESQILQKEC